MSCRDITGDTPSNFRQPNVVVITSSGSYTSPPNVDYLEVYAIGGGGGSGGGVGGGPQGSGGGAGAPSFKFFPPGTYAITVGAGGARATGSSSGSAGGQTDFGGGQLIGLGGGGGSGGATADPRRGGLAGGIHASATYTLAREAGHPGTVDRGGAGGSNYFGSGGLGILDPSGTWQGFAGISLGGGASGGLNGVGGSTGADGGVIIIEHY